MRKSDDKDSTYFRSGDRVFCLNGKWYYQTREDDHGPFATREAAEKDLQRYVDEMRFFDGVRDREPAAQQDDAPTDLPLVAKD
jgi:hypothetical protein